MTPTHFRHALMTMHWTQRGVARILGVDDRTVRRWANGDYPVPADVAAWLIRCETFMKTSGTPRRTR